MRALLIVNKDTKLFGPKSLLIKRLANPQIRNTGVSEIRISP